MTHHHLLLSFVAAASFLTAELQPTKPAAPAPPKSTEAPKAEPPKDAPAKGPEEKPAAAAEYKTAEELLAALETADKKIQTITAELNFTTVKGEIEGRDMQRRHGQLFFRNRSDAKAPDGKPAPDAHAAAAVKFDYLILVQSGNKKFDEHKTYVVNGKTVIERIEKEKLINRFKIGKGDQDPLMLGQGPFPLPFGQRKDEVLTRFKAELVPSLEELEKIHPQLRTRFEGTYQLKLTPKADAGIATDVKAVRVWYQKKDLIPVLARIMRPDDGFDEFFLVGTQVNKPLPEDVFDTTVPDGWKVEEKERP